MKIKRFEFNMFPVNCYVLWDETNEAVMIDPGCFYDTDEEKHLFDLLRRAYLEARYNKKNFIVTNNLNIKHLLNTHLHLDHIFGNPFMLREFGLSAEANQADEYWIDEAPKQSRMFGFQLNEAPVHWENISMTETSSPSETQHWKQSMYRDTLPEALSITAGLTTVCFRAMCCFREASDGPTWPEATLMN